jgi:hypothetical protein
MISRGRVISTTDHRSRFGNQKEHAPQLQFSLVYWVRDIGNVRAHAGLWRPPRYRAADEHVTTARNGGLHVLFKSRPASGLAYTRLLTEPHCCTPTCMSTTAARLQGACRGQRWISLNPDRPRRAKPLSTGAAPTTRGGCMWTRRS